MLRGVASTGANENSVDEKRRIRDYLRRLNLRMQKTCLDLAFIQIF